MWWMLAQAALSAASMYGQGALNKAVTEANNRVGAAKADADNRVRSSGNAFNAARGSLARYMQSLNNGEALAAGGHALEANLINARRNDDALASASFEDQIKAAEQTGAQAAAAAFAGVGGEVADTISLSTRLMQQRAAYEATQRRDFSAYDAARRAGVIQTQTIRSLDSSLILDAVDYSVDVAPQRPSMNPWLSALYAAGNSSLSSLSFGVGRPATAPGAMGKVMDTADYGGSI